MSIAQVKILCEISQRGRDRGFERTGLRRSMRRAAALLSAGVLAVGVLILGGCETGRANKLHSGFESVSDLTTVPHPNLQYASIDTGNPPVPGSPTAAGPNGLQPVNDNQARPSPGTDEGADMAPREQPVDSFVRQ
jgi:hypothetical protein